MERMNIAIITGASSGLGKEFVKLLVNDNNLDKIFVLARNEEKLNNLKSEFGNKIQPYSIDLSDIDTFACSIGPGSFTGVRIGIASIKAIAKVTNKKIFGTTSLGLLAIDGIKRCTFKPKYVLSLMDARNQRAYYNLYKYENFKLESLDFYGNDYAKDIITNVKNMNLEDLLIVIDNNSNINLENVIIANLDLKNIFELDMTRNLFDYLNLDAMYYRKSEAERTTEGE